MAFEKELRTEERFPINAQSACAFVSPVLEDFGPVRIKNVSQQGIGLITPQSLEVGWLLAIKIVNNNKSFSKTILVRVVHCTKQPGGAYLVGGSFDSPLSYDELCNLVM